jgi:hypothetical protein
MEVSTSSSERFQTLDHPHASLHERGSALTPASPHLQAVFARQLVPHSRADVELLLDAEEGQQHEAAALEQLHGKLAEGSALEAMALLPAAGRQAAAAAARVWCDWELEAARVLDEAIISATDEEQAQMFGRKLLLASNNDVLLLPAWQAAGQERELPGSHGISTMKAAGAAAAQAAEEALSTFAPSHNEGQAPSVPGGVSATGSANTVAERGVPAAQATLEGMEEMGGELGEGEPSLEAALKLEARVWAEVDALMALATKIRKEVQPPLMEGLRRLRPYSKGGSVGL